MTRTPGPLEAPLPDTPVPSGRVRAAGVDTFFYDTGTGEVPTICVHGNPDSADAWLPILHRAGEIGRVIAPDLPGFGRSERPDPAAFDATLVAYVAWFDAFVDALDVPRFNLVVHDWGSLALAAAARRPQQLERLVAIDIVPLSADYRWHWLATYLWRPRVVGEVGMTVFNRFTIKLLTRLQRPGLRPLDADLLDRVKRDLDPGMKRAILSLYRSADPELLGRYGANLPDVVAPALVLWGTDDPYVGPHEADVLTAALGGPTETALVKGGHWPMLDTDDVFDRTIAFLGDGTGA
ncbi:alpha/beta fold hydrolase [Patulibacter sp.]|uniref:alpha/beta fold hydrolase n=1 Tax=Patulibacter sp. TaxID=1912859 RepID=UPI0027195199|nr:alpha/beta hydrolase [Patulibacter sp.]MDO9406945.1 alpha/beta hydrolase [Patulibacter sp.]